MPIYDYRCDACGPFTAIRPLAEATAKQACPDCGTAAARTLSVGQLKLGRAPDAGPRRAKPSSHPTGCACCSSRVASLPGKAAQKTRFLE